jgi:hypothetical protein
MATRSILVSDISTQRRRVIRDYWLITLVVSTLGAALLALLDYPVLPSSLALLLLMLCLYPSVRYGIEGGSIVPAVPILSGMYGVIFALPVFFGDATLFLTGGTKTISNESLVIALAIAISSFVAFLGISYSRKVATLINRLPVIELHLNRTRALAFCVFFGVLVLGTSTYFSSLPLDVKITYSAIYRVIESQLLVAIGILAWLTYTSPSVELRILYYLFITAAVFNGLSSGFLEMAVVPLGIMFACQWIYGHRVNAKLAVFLVGALLFLNPVKGDYREAVWFSGTVSLDASRLEKSMFWMDTAWQYWSDVFKGRLSGEDAGYQLVRRTNMIDLLAHIYESTPEPVPYMNGETYSYFLYSLVPRIVWPDKPVTTANRKLAVEYELTTAEGAERSTFGISLLGEGYANFGWLGAVMIMCILALALLALQRVLTTERSGPGGYALFLAIFVFFLNGIGGSAEILLGNVLQNVIVGTLLILFATERGKRSVTRA